MSSLLIAHPPGRTTNETNSRLRMASVYRRATEECEVPPLDIGVQAIPALAISLRRCRATTYTSSVVPRFTDMLLSPFPFGSRLVVRLGVICPELRPTTLAIPSARFTAHSFPARGSSRPNAPLTGRAAIVSYGNFTILRRRRHPFHLPVNYAGSRQQLLGCSLFYELLFWRHHQLSRDERPGGSLPAFAWGDVARMRGATPIRSTTERPSLSPPSLRQAQDRPLPAVPSARLAARFPQRGGLRAYHVPLVYPHGLGLSSTPGVLHLR